MNSPAETHQWVAEYNWDDGLAPVWPIARNDETEFATALMIYWRLGGPWLEKTGNEASEEAWRLQGMVKERLLAGCYPKRVLQYDPVADNQLSQTQLYQLRKAGIPAELIEPTYPATP